MSLAKTLAQTNKSTSASSRKLFNNDSIKPGKLGGIIQSASGIQKNVAGTISGVGNVVAKAAGALGAGGLANALTGSVNVKYSEKYDNKDGEGIGTMSYSWTSEGKQKEVDDKDTKGKIPEYTSSGGLRGFYDMFSGKSMKLTERVDPLLTFDCYFEFFPSIFDSTPGKKASSLDTTAASTAALPPDAITSKLLSLVGFQYDPHVEVDFGFYIQKVNLPSINVEGGEEIASPVGKFTVPGSIVAPDSNTFNMEIVNVETPVIENILYPWMRETTLPCWSYEKQPYTTANVTFDFSEHANVKYRFIGCRPTSIYLIQPDQAASQQATRNVQFTYQFMTIETLETNAAAVETKKEKKGGSPSNGRSASKMAQGALFSAANSLRL